MRLKFYIWFVFVAAIVGCEEIPVETVYYDFSNHEGVFISCEGNFMYGNASLSFYDRNEKKVYNKVFYARNNTPLGDVAQSVILYENVLYVVVNNSGKIFGVDPENAEFKGVVTGLTSPRYMHFVNDSKAYVSDIYARSISVIDLNSFVVTKQIDVSDGKEDSGKHPTEQFVQVGNYVFVTCWSYDEYVLIINSETDEVIDSIKTPMQPKDILVDKNGKIWILNDGSFDGSVTGSEPPKLIRIEPVTRTIEQIYTFDTDDDSPANLKINNAGDTLIFAMGDIWKMPVTSRRLPESIFIPADGKLFYSLAIDPDNDDIYAADAIDYSQSAIIYRYSSNGSLIDSFKVGINPGGYCFIGN